MADNLRRILTVRDGVDAPKYCTLLFFATVVKIRCLSPERFCEKNVRK